MAIDLKNIEKKKAKKKKREFNLNWLNTDINLSGNKIRDQKKENFYSELHILLSSGIDIKTCFEIIVEEQKKESDKKLFKNIFDKIIEGNSLSETLAETKKFTPYEYYSLRIGEESGKIVEVLKELASYFNKKIKQRRQLVNAFTYPTLVLITAIFAVFFMMNFIVPMFVDVFKRFQGELPSLTQKIVNISNFIRESTGEMLFIILVIIALFFIVRKKEKYRQISSFILLKLPLFGEIVRKIYISKFCQSMSLLLSSKTPMLRSIQLVKNMISF